MTVFPGTAMTGLPARSEGPPERRTLQQKLHASAKAASDEPSRDCPGAAFVKAHGDPAHWPGETCDAYLDLVHAEGLR
ncbi:hypothetical protein [Streptomyces hesseae]|uniref:Uncharacterized protein n=1 Tax=Streptomyces hesseae TaxID=3075519 RepID=A0ABU2SYE8_9ACTN|nr:hypothetical protein [Streptomyces sp. DSM 40473]MDT0453753.1 hypothetical protein [Streptomyces sp. DSM 40473]